MSHSLELDNSALEEIARKASYGSTSLRNPPRKHNETLRINVFGRSIPATVQSVNARETVTFEMAPLLFEPEGSTPTPLARLSVAPVLGRLHEGKIQVLTGLDMRAYCIRENIELLVMTINCTDDEALRLCINDAEHEKNLSLPGKTRWLNAVMEYKVNSAKMKNASYTMRSLASDMNMSETKAADYVSFARHFTDHLINRVKDSTSWTYRGCLELRKLLLSENDAVDTATREAFDTLQDMLNAIKQASGSPEHFITARHDIINARADTSETVSVMGIEKGITFESTPEGSRILIDKRINQSVILALKKTLKDFTSN